MIDLKTQIWMWKADGTANFVPTLKLLKVRNDDHDVGNAMASRGGRHGCDGKRSSYGDRKSYYSVASTEFIVGHRARPLAKRSNVHFYETIAAAETAGFRPCCRPNELTLEGAARDENPDGACRFVEEAEDVPKLDVLPRCTPLSPHHFNRLSK